MQYTIVTLLATVASLASAQSSAAPSMSPIGAVVPVGEACTPGGTMCALGSQCYAVNSMQQPRCGNFQATCTSNQQCAYNTCNIAPGGTTGACNGFIPSSSAKSSTPIVTSTPTGGYTPGPSPTISAPVASLSLGAQCNPFVGYNQCAGGASCYASNSGLIPVCGNFNAACSSNSQCAFNTCSNGLCSGFLASSSAGNATMTASSSGASKPSTMTGSATKSATGSASKTMSLPEFTGAAATFVPEVLAVVLGVAAWAL